MPRPWIQEFEGQRMQMSGEIDSPLRSRAWVLQEKELSNCTIYFGKNQLLWENKELRATAQVPWEEMKPETRSETPRMMRETPSRQIVGAPQYAWYQLVEDYASRDLSFPSDKLVAFSGLAKAFGRDPKARYLAGNWSTDLPAALLWQVKDNAATRPAYLAPLWSWASLMGSVSYDSLRLEPDHDCAQYEYPEDIYDGLKTLKVESAQVVLDSKDKPYGDVREGRILLSGARCIKVQYKQFCTKYKDGGQPLYQERASIGVFYQDIAGQTAVLKEAYCVALQSESLWSLRSHQFGDQQKAAMTSTVMGVVLERHSTGRQFRRVGLARWIDESLFNATQPATIELI